MGDMCVLHDLLNRFSSADENAAAFSIYDGEKVTEITYRKFLHDILDAAGYFAENNIVHQHIALAAPNSYTWIKTFFAIIVSGNVAVLMNPDLPKDVLAWQCAKADVSMICGERTLQEEFGDAEVVPVVLLEQVKGSPFSIEKLYSAENNETIIMFFTSGTTGQSKAVEITASNFRYSIKNFEEPFILDGMERIMTPIPFCHIFGFLHIIETLNHCKTVCLGRGIGYLFFDMAFLNPDMLSTVPSVLESLAKFLKRNSSKQAGNRGLGENLKLITYGGASLQSNVGHYFIDLGLKLYVCYGMTEISCGATWGDVDIEHSNTAGKFCEYIEYRFENGELLVTGPTLMKGYYKDPEETAKVIEKGWLHTGDLGYCDENGYFYLTGRKKNVIILSNGENVNPEEIEAKFALCNAILESLVYGDGKGICADIYTDNPDEANRFVKEYNQNVPMYQQVYKVNCVAEPLEKTGIGKIKRKENKNV